MIKKLYASTAMFTFLCSDVVLANDFTSLINSVSKPEVVIFYLVIFIISYFLLNYLVYEIKIGGSSARNLINKDSLTKVNSMYKFTKTVEKTLQNAQENEFMFISIDIDNFKYINELYGYSKGSEIIQSVATALQEGFPEPISCIARVRADEFIVFTKKMDYETLSIIFNKGKSNFDRIITDRDLESVLVFSIGIYEIDNPSLSITSMMDYAAIARKANKNMHGTSVVYYTKEMEETRISNNRVVSNMQNALKNKEFILYLQPKINIQTNSIHSAEVLVRWKTEDGLIPPYRFIPVFEKNGFIYNLDLYMLREVCLLLSNDEFKKQCNIESISVNISRVTLLKKGISKELSEICNEYNINKEMIELEVTESMFTGDKKTLINTLNEIKEDEFLIAIDDFGNEYSALISLFEIPADAIKLDRGFINNLDSPKGQDLISSTINMLQNLNCLTVAEGIETKEQYKALKEYNCDLGQGYYFAKPMPVDEFMEFCKNWKGIENIENM